jgi:hypothetical protein
VDLYIAGQKKNPTVVISKNATIIPEKKRCTHTQRERDQSYLKKCTCSTLDVYSRLVNSRMSNLIPQFL